MPESPGAGTGGGAAARLDPWGLARSLGLSLEVDDRPRWPLPGSRYGALARGGPVFGTAVGPTADAAALVAVMEQVERSEQFSPGPVPVAATGSAAELGARALPPEELGLYSAPQYESGAAGVAPFRRDQPLEWVEVRDLMGGPPRLVPVEFVYPRACAGRARLVAETSSGTAAHPDPEQATLGALCEVVERDGAMLFWYRRPPTGAWPLDALPDPAAAAELRRVREMGYVVVVLDLAYDLGVPRFLLLALRGDDLAWGAGCHPAAGAALAHAAGELAARLRWLEGHPSRRTLRLPLHRVETAADHHALFHRGPLHRALRDALEQAVVPARPAAPGQAGSTASATLPLAQLLAALARRGLRAYACEVARPATVGRGIHVVRVLVPGLVPLHVGHDRMRLGCRRLSGPDAPGRLCTFLPHFLG